MINCYNVYIIMNKYIYIIANLRQNKESCENIWMNTKPFVELNHESNKITLQMISDIFINFLENEKSIIYFSLYRIKNNMKEFFLKREDLFKNINLLPDYAEKIGFEKMNDFEYIVDPLNKKQISNGFEIKFNYTKDKMFDGKIYITHPIITFYL
jgi:hypothetical protein